MDTLGTMATEGAFATAGPMAAPTGRRADELVVSQYRPLEIYTFLVVEYFLLIICISSWLRWLENRLRSAKV